MTSGPHSALIQPSSTRWRILLFLMALCFVSHFNRTSMASAADERIMKQFGISTEQMGVVYSAFLIVYTIFMIPGGFFIDRFGPRVALALMGMGTALFCACTGMVGWGLIAASQIWLSLVIVRSLMGLLTTPLHPASARAAANWFPDRQRALANGLITGAALLGNASVYLLFGAMIDRFDWPTAFLISGGCTAGLALIWFLSSADHPRPGIGCNSAEAHSNPKSSTANEETQGIGSLLKNRNLILLTLSYAAVGYFQYLFFYWMHYYFDEVLRMGKTDSRFYALLPSLATAVCMPLGGWLTDKASKLPGETSGRTLVPRIGMIVSPVLLLFGIFATQTLWIVLWFTLSLGVLGLCEGAFWATAIELGGTRGGTAAAIMNTGGNGIGLLAPMVTPFVSARLGWKWGIGLGALIGLLGALCWWWIKPVRHEKST